MKKTIVVIIPFLLVINLANAQNQTCNCKEDLDFTVEKLKKMPSYKKQIKGQKLDEFNKSYVELSQIMSKPIDVESCYKLLLKQMLLINDVHANLYLKPKYKAQKNYTANIKSTINISELKNQLANKDINDIEGLYQLNDKLLIGVFYNNSKTQLMGLVLDSKLDNWIKGDVKFIATYVQGSKYNVYHYDTENKTPMLVKSLSFENGRLWSYKKMGNDDNAELPIKEQDDWVFKTIEDNIQYLYFGHFSNSKKRKHLDFFEETKNKLTAKNIIVDLRSNAGGNKKFSDPYLKLLKNKNVYVLTNCFTGSNGEQFTIKLKNLKNGTHLGQTTRGVIAYGINYGYNYNSPSGFFSLTPTDMNFHEFNDYESKGATPDIALKFDEDWIQQTIELIKNNI